MKCFSFIIPVYNCGEYLADCINSILSIKLEKFEIILVDDGSRDESGCICDEFFEKFDNIKVFHQENQGVSTARNCGIAAATGEYIIFIDADDTIDPQKFRKILPIIENDNSIDMMMFGMSFDYYYDGSIYRRDEKIYPDEGIMEAKQWSKAFYSLYINNSISPLWNKVFKREIIVEHRLMLNKEMFLYEDLEFVVRYMAYCNKIYNSTEIVYYYRQTEDEGNAKRRLKRIDSLSDFIKQIEQPLEDLVLKLNCDKNDELEIKSILLHLYLVLAREKTAVSSRKEIYKICNEMQKWLKVQNPEIQQHLSEDDKKYISMIADCRISKLILKNKLTAVRHRLAVFVKNTSIYKRFKE